MGMYTEIVAGFAVRSDAPEAVKETVRRLCAGDAVDAHRHEHPFFSCERWNLLALCGSYYFPGPTHSLAVDDSINGLLRISIRSNLKNYDGEVERFWEWVAPYAETGRDYEEFVGYSLYEEEHHPTLIYFDRGRVVSRPFSTPAGDQQKESRK